MQANIHVLMSSSSIASHTMHGSVAANAAGNSTTQQHTIFFGLAL